MEVETKEEHEQCKKCREYVESLITWPCSIIKKYSESNLGVYRNIGEGAKWVFEKEEMAIFLEDDNLPEVSFFDYCKELLNRYRSEERILWVCGTNYLGKYSSDYSYMFTKHMLPCGWASWSDKFLKYYDGYLEKLNDEKLCSEFKNSYRFTGIKGKSLFHSQLLSAQRTKYLIDTNINTASWDWQMNYSVRANGMFGISPANNQIKNIGVDEFSIHGGSTFKNKGVSKLCGMDSYSLDFPMKHPSKIELDLDYEKKITSILAPAWHTYYVRMLIIKPLKHILGLKEFDSFAEYLKKRKNKK